MTADEETLEQPFLAGCGSEVINLLAEKRPFPSPRWEKSKRNSQRPELAGLSQIGFQLRRRKAAVCFRVTRKFQT